MAKLAPCAQVGRAEFGVWPDGDRLMIWGLVHHGSRTYGIDLEHNPTYFSARILRVGTFTVHFDERLQLLFSRDHGRFFDRDLDLLGTLRDRAGIEPNVAQALCRVAKRMVALGHGGTILVVDRGASHKGLVHHPALAQESEPHAIVSDAMRIDEEASSGEMKLIDEPIAQYVTRRRRIERAHDEALDFIAHLTGIDGAVVVDTELGLLGAGATIQTPDSAMPDQVILEDPRSGKDAQVPLASIGGNRHRSAVCFCAQQDGPTVALVASQDGDLSLVMRRTDGKIQILRPYELGVGL